MLGNATESNHYNTSSSSICGVENVLIYVGKIIIIIIIIDIYDLSDMAALGGFL